MTEFDNLLALADDPTLSCISTAEGVRSHLFRRPEVLALRNALETGSVTFDDVQAFVRQLIAPFVRGTRSAADAVLAAIVVAIEPLAITSISDFLEDLARVKVAEMPMSPRVSRLALRERAKHLVQVTVREFIIAVPVPAAFGPPREDHPIKIESGIDYRTLDLRSV